MVREALVCRTGGTGEHGKGRMGMWWARPGGVVQEARREVCRPSIVQWQERQTKPVCPRLGNSAFLDSARC